MILAFFAFLSGIVTILSPCILPVLPIILSGSVGGKRKPLGVVTGFVFSFSLFTLILSTVVQSLQIPPETLRLIAVIIIIVFGLVLLIPFLQKQFELLASRLFSRKKASNKNGFGGGLLVGASLGLLWTPCVGPIMASVISLAVSQQVDGGAVIIIIAYSAGTALPMMGVMLSGRKLLARFPKLSSSTGRIQRIFGAVMIIVGLSVGFGLDRKFQTAILTAFPNYGTGLTSFENSKLVRDALSKRDNMSIDNEPRDGKLEDFGPAPEILTDGRWFNTEEPLTMDKLKGKVVLIDFWTYSCVNCVRTLPYLRAWHKAYADDGLVIIGVHSPEFAFERDAGNLLKAIDDLGVTWPVVQDNSFDQWRAYNNRYWPAHYFIDAEGTIRYFHFGEGEYETSEQVIRKLLEEAGHSTEARAETVMQVEIESRTPELYLGYQRTFGFLSEYTKVDDVKVTYSFSEKPENGEWNLQGHWIIRKDFIETDSNGSLELGFNAGDVYLVIEPVSEDTSVKVLIDGIPAAGTADSESGVIYPDKSRLYHLAELTEAGPHVLRLITEGKIRFYAFTFG